MIPPSKNQPQQVVPITTQNTEQPQTVKIKANRRARLAMRKAAKQFRNLPPDERREKINEAGRMAQLRR